jgi:hypothetical protein
MQEDKKDVTFFETKEFATTSNREVASILDTQTAKALD